MGEKDEPSIFWVLFLLALCADIVLRLLDRFDPPKIATQEKLFLAGTTGTSATRDFSIMSGTATITAGTTQILIPHGMQGIPQAVCSPDNFVMFSCSADASNIEIDIDAPQAVDVIFNYVARL